MKGADYNSYSDWMDRGPLAAYVKRFSFVGNGAVFIEAAQPEGDMSDPAVNDLVLVRIATPGMHARFDFGGGRVEERCSFSSFGLVAPNFANKVEVFHNHKIQVLGIDMATVSKALEGETGQGISCGDFGRLHRGTFSSDKISATLTALSQAADDVHPSAKLFAGAALQFIVAELAAIAGKPIVVGKGGLAPWQIRRCTEALMAADADLTLAQLASSVGLSPFHFCRAFKESVGVAPHRYQMMLRAERARAMLESTDKSITDIAFTVGYGSSQALARVFRREFGVSPSDYRSIHKR